MKPEVPDGASIVEVEGLREEVRLLRERLDDKRRLLANMSHEIRTPLNGVLGMLAVLGRSDLLPRQRRFVEAARTSAQALHTLLDDILELSRLEMGKLELREADFDLRGLVEQATELAAARAREKGLEVGCFFQRQVPPVVRGDAERLRQVLGNLLSNAVKFTECGEITLRVSIEEESDAAALVRFEVADTGVGIERTEEARIFEPFSQIEPVRRIDPGAGLGLAICRELVSLMGGAIKVSSTPGVGSTFSFAIPLAKGGAELMPEKIDEALASALLLVVDPNASSRMILEEILGSWGVRSASAANGDRAYNMLVDASHAQEPFDIVIVDAQLAEADGWSFTRVVRENPVLGDVGILLVSSFGDLEGDEQLTIAGFDGSVSKPVRAGPLRDALERLLHRRSRPTPMPVVARPSEQSGPFRRVLLAEDNGINQEVAVEMLRALDCKVDVVADGVDAVEAATKARYDLVLMDCQLPRLDGLRAAAEIRRLRDPGGPPIVALTAEAQIQDKERILRAGMDDYLTKPVTHAALEKVLSRWAPHAPSRAASGSHGTITSAPPKKVRVEGYTRRIAPDLATMKDHAVGGRTEELRALAHKVKGACLVLGLERMAKLCDVLEGLDRDALVKNGPFLVAKLSGELRRAEAELEGTA